MIESQSISAMVDALDSPGIESVAAMLPEGAEASAVVALLADEAERRIMADLSRAVRTTAALVSLADSRALPVVRARVRRVGAQALTYANRFDEAFNGLSEAMPLAEEAGDRVECGRIQLAMLHVFARQARFNEAIACGVRARAAFEASGERALVGRAENNLGILERMSDRPGLAIGHFERASRELTAEPPLLAHVENNRAEALLDLDRFAEAEQAFRAAFTAFRAANATRHAGIVLGNLADLASRQGRLHDALLMFEEARRVLDQASSPGDSARLAVEHADVLQSLGMLPLAVRAYEAATPVLASHKMSAESARAHLGLGCALTRIGHSRAAEELARAEELFRELKNDSGRARALAMQADAAASRGDHLLALSLLQEANAAVGDRPAARSWVGLLTAKVHLSAGQFELASTTASAAATSAETLGVLPLAADLLQVQGRALRAGGDFRRAAATLRHAVQLAERCRGSLQTDGFRSAFLGDRAAIWEDCASAILDAADKDSHAEAFAMVEMSKSRSLLDFLAGGRDETSESTGNVDDGMVRELSLLTGELNALYAKSHEAIDAAGASAGRLRDEISTREAKAESLMVRLSAIARFAGTFASPVALRELVPTIPHDGAIVEYFAEGQMLSAYVLRSRDHDGGRSVTVRRGIASVASVRAALALLMFQIGRAMARGLPTGERGERFKHDAIAELDAIGLLILHPLMGALDGCTRVVVVPTGPLHGVPFPALGTAGAGSPRLLERMDVAISPSASVLERIAPPVLGRGAMMIGVADERAPRAEAEAHDVASFIPGASVLTGPAATRQAFLERCGGCSHLHVASHARYVPSNPAASGLRLSDGWLTARELSKLYLSGASVLLSGCDTGRSAVTGGDDQTGLTRAVLSAGASSVTTTLWPVHDTATAELMGMAYRSMTEKRTGLDPSVDPRTIGASLLAAQRSQMKAGEHPAAWAPFVTVYKPW
jgi:tetratricopeptide (TPR) repeat protein